MNHFITIKKWINYYPNPIELKQKLEGIDYIFFGEREKELPFATALEKALDIISRDIEAAGGLPSINAALGALTAVQGRLIAMQGERNIRRAMVAAIEREVPKAIRAAQTNPPGGKLVTVKMPDRMH